MRKAELRMTGALFAAALLVSVSARVSIAGPPGHWPRPPLVAPPLIRASACASPQGAPRAVRNKDEREAYQALQNEKDPRTKLAKAQAFLARFPETEIKDLVYLQMLSAYRGLGDTAKAIEAGRQAVLANPRYSPGFYNLGVEYLDCKPRDYNQAVWNLARAVALARAGRDSSADDFEKLLKRTYVEYHGSEDGLPAIIAQAANSPTPPEGFAVPYLPLYVHTPVSPEDVVQGGLGSCYFHSTIAAIAGAHPEKVQEIIHDNGDGTYTVRFDDGKQEKAYPEDLRYARQSGFDKSKGSWAGVLLRAYAQRVLRAALGTAVDKSDLFPPVKQYVRDFLTTNDPVLLAYDRAIRAVVDQSGDIDQAKLEANLKERLASLPIPDEAKDLMVKTLEPGGFFQTIAETVKQEAEVFGAYRAVGRGGMPARVMQTFLGGKTVALRTPSRTEVPLLLSRSFRSARPVVAGTWGIALQTLQAKKPLPEDAAAWYVESHAYTVLGYDPQAQTVTLRNPWGHNPDPDGTFTISLPAFLDAFETVETTAP
jgi:hypothetical protein